MNTPPRTIHIPKQVRLFGQVIDVVTDLDHRDDCWGEADYARQRIRLAPSRREQPLTRSHIEHTYLHELVHWMLRMMQHPQRADEAFVDMLAGLFHQATTTGTGTCRVGI